MHQSIFSTYRQGENRVTASILAVLRSLTLSRFQRLIGSLIDYTDVDLIQVENQPSRGGEGIPDGEISASFRILIETKLPGHPVDKEQIDRHLARFVPGGERLQRLLVLTADTEMPALLQEYDPQVVVWSTFVRFDQAIDELLSDDTEVISEREAFLLRELRLFLEAEGLLRIPTDTMIVAARFAWPYYEEFSAYICQPGRSFRPSEHIAFYTGNEIKPLVPKIQTHFPEVVFSLDGANGYPEALNTLMTRSIQAGVHKEGEALDVYILTPPYDESTIKLNAPIRNTKRDKNDKPVAYTMGSAKYVSIDKLRAAKTTTELDVERG